MHHYFPDKDHLMKPFNPLIQNYDREKFDLQLEGLDFKDGIKILNTYVRENGEFIPPLVNIYMHLSPTMKTFGTAVNPDFGNVLREADLAILDGMPLCWAYQLTHGFKPDRIAGKHLMHALLLEATQNKMSVFFYGSSHEKLIKTEAYLTQNYPGLMIAGMISPPFRSLSFEENMAYVDLINASGASLVFVALGCPKQEIWMHNMKAHIHATMIGVGGAMEVLTGQQKRPPLWIENIGMEWFFRLCLEPRRLFKRYLITNSYFIFLLFRALLQKK
jgi:N-acetylglucosaminyldiphosphoundecaprenol N-acetyl-beta-D-mannosaminyltransferase